MGMDKIRKANKKWKHEQARKVRRKKAPYDTPVGSFKRRLRDNRKHHRPQDGRNQRNNITQEEDIS